MSSWVRDSISYQIKRSLDKSGQELEEMLEIKNKAAILKQELSTLSVEKDYFESYYNESNVKIAPYRALYEHNSDTIMELWLDYQRMAESKTG